jgi:hypothetical protein
MILLEPRCYAVILYDLFLFWIFTSGFYTLGAPVNNLLLQIREFFL